MASTMYHLEGSGIERKETEKMARSIMRKILSRVPVKTWILLPTHRRDSEASNSLCSLGGVSFDELWALFIYTGFVIYSNRSHGPAISMDDLRNFIAGYKTVDIKERKIRWHCNKFGRRVPLVFLYRGKYKPADDPMPIFSNGDSHPPDGLLELATPSLTTKRQRGNAANRHGDYTCKAIRTVRGDTKLGILLNSYRQKHQAYHLCRQLLPPNKESSHQLQPTSLLKATLLWRNI